VTVLTSDERYGMKIIILPLLVSLLLVSPVLAANAVPQPSPLYLFYKGYESVRQGKFNEALEYYKSALSLDPNSDVIKTELAFLFASKGEIQKAETLLVESLISPVKNRRTLLLLARIYLSKGQFDKAKGLYEECLKLNDEDTEAYIFLGSIYTEQKKYKEAVEVYEKILTYDDESLMALYHAARMRTAIKDFDKAKTYFEKILAINPDFDMGREDFSIRESIGYIYMQEGKYDEAIKEFNLILAEKPNQIRIRIYLAMALQEKGEIKPAIAELLKVDSTAKEFPIALKGLLGLYVKAEAVDEGIMQLKSMLQKDEKNVELHLGLASLYEEKDEYDKGIAILEKVRVLAPKNMEILYQLGMLTEKRGDNPGAIKIMEEIIKEEPDNAGALNFIGYSLAEKGVDLDRAEALIKKALEKRPEDGYIRDSLGWVYYGKGEYQKALEELTKANEIASDDPTILDHMADVYVKLNQYDKAREALSRSIELEKKEDRKKQLQEKLKGLQNKR
jgi:tetratricopeptide (TPR) repeat protein